MGWFEDYVNSPNNVPLIPGTNTVANYDTNAYRPPSATLDPATARYLMQMSMTAGVPTQLFDQYGGYNAVSSMYNANGGTYDPKQLDPSILQAGAGLAAKTGTGNMSAIDWAKQSAPTAPATTAPSGRGDPFLSGMFSNWLQKQNAATQPSLLNPPPQAQAQPMPAGGPINRWNFGGPNWQNQQPMQPSVAAGRYGLLNPQMQIGGPGGPVKRNPYTR